MTTLRLPKVMGHRGAAGLAPENTLASIRKVAACGLEWVEFDVMLAGDGVPILFHDDTLERTTGRNGLVAQTPSEEMLALDAGAWFGPDFAGELVPSFAAALDLVRACGLRVNVEIKPTAGTEVETAQGVVSELSRLWPASEPIPMISSFHTSCLEVAKDLRPDWPRAYISFEVSEHWHADLTRLDCASFHLWHRLTDAELVREIKDMGLGMACFTVNETTLARRLFDIGVDCVITDDPPVVLEALDQ
jgi:glycerophosphoryl diester phosphodiesterase